MHIKEVDVKVLIYCEEDLEIDILINEMKKLYEYREDLLVEEWFKDDYGNDVYCVVLNHTDGADILQLQLYKQGIEIN